MAKITLTLEDSLDDTGKPTVSLDMTGVPVGMPARQNPSAAVEISGLLWGMASCEQILGDLPAYRLQPSNKTLH